MMPAPQGPAAPQVGKEPPAAPLLRGPWPVCRRVTALPVCLVSRQRAGPLPGPMGQACPAQVALALTRALHPWSGAEGAPLRDDLHQAEATAALRHVRLRLGT